MVKYYKFTRKKGKFLRVLFKASALCVKICWISFVISSNNNNHFKRSQALWDNFIEKIYINFFFFFFKNFMLAFISVWGSKLFNVFIIKSKWLIMGGKKQSKNLIHIKTTYLKWSFLFSFLRFCFWHPLDWNKLIKTQARKKQAFLND